MTGERSAPKRTASALDDAVLLGLAHAAVDAATVTALYRTLRVVETTRMEAFLFGLLYILLAFGLQPLVGWLADRSRAPRALLTLGFLLPLAALATHAHTATLTVALAGLGNAMFHVGAGVLILEHGLERTAPAGVFVGPGALGLGFGIWYGSAPEAGPVWPLALLLLVGLWWSRLPRRVERAPGAPLPGAAPRALAGTTAWGWLLGVLVLLSVSIAIRSVVGMSATRGCPKTALLLLGVPLAGCLGKALGGFVADRFGWLESTSLALVISGPLIAWGAELPLLLLVALLIFQTTMPVTLIAVARALPRRPGLAFGLPCLALALGSLPTAYHGVDFLLVRPLLLAWTGLALVAVVGGLWWLGVRPKPGLERPLGERMTS